MLLPFAAILNGSLLPSVIISAGLFKISKKAYIGLEAAAGNLAVLDKKNHNM